MNGRMRSPTEPIPRFSKSESDVRRIITAIVGEDSVDSVGPVFAVASLCLREAARCYDDGDYLASCVMSRGALEAAFLGFLYTRRVSLGPKDRRVAFMPIKPPWDTKHRVRPKFDDLFAKVKGRVALSSRSEKAIRRIKRDGDLSAHLAERYWESFWRVVTKSRAQRRLPGGRRQPVRGRWSWPTAPIAFGRLKDVSKIIGRLSVAKLA